VKRAHTEDNMTVVIIDMLKFYEIVNKLEYMMLDNAFNNNTTVRSIIEELAMHEHESEEMTKKHCCLRCAEHIFNLMMKTLLFRINKNALKMNEVNFAAWRKLESIGKLYNIVRYVHASSQRRDSFLALQSKTLQSEG
jgi:U3 small nucleolar RNA-associated protein 14